MYEGDALVIKPTSSGSVILERPHPAGKLIILMNLFSDVIVAWLILINPNTKQPQLIGLFLIVSVVFTQLFMMYIFLVRKEIQLDRIHGSLSLDRVFLGSYKSKLWFRRDLQSQN